MNFCCFIIAHNPYYKVKIKALYLNNIPEALSKIQILSWSLQTHRVKKGQALIPQSTKSNEELWYKEKKNDSLKYCQVQPKENPTQIK